MATVKFEAFLDHIIPAVRLAPEDLILQQLNVIGGDFCQLTRAWQYDGAPLTVIANQATYALITPAGAEPCALEYLAVDAVPSIPKSVEWFDRFLSQWRTRKGDDFRYFTQLTRKTFTFPGIPTVNGTADGITWRVSLKPHPDSDEIDEDIYTEWHDVLAAGAKAALMAMDGERWANVKLAQKYQQDYIQGRTEARIRAAKGYSDSEMTASGIYRFGGR